VTERAAFVGSAVARQLLERLFVACPGTANECPVPLYGLDLEFGPCDLRTRDRAARLWPAVRYVFMSPPITCVGARSDPDPRQQH